MVWLSEADLENWLLSELEGQGFERLSGADISPEGHDPLRPSFRDKILTTTFEASLRKLNPGAARWRYRRCHGARARSRLCH